MRRLTESIIEGLKVPPKGYRVYYDTTPGLGVRVSETGSHAFVFDYSAPRTSADIEAGRYPRRRVTLSAQTLADARAEASDLRARILETKHEGAQRFDPIEARKAAREQAAQEQERTQAEQELEARTLNALADQWLTKHAEQKKRPASLANDRSLLDRYILKALGSRKVADLTFAEIENLMAGMAETPVMANRCHSLLKTILNYGIKQGWIANNLAASWTKHKEHPRNVQRSETELTRLHDALDAHPNQQSADAVRLLLYTGSRRGEVLGARWSEFDLEKENVWLKPAARNKQREDSNIPLRPDALDVLHKIRREQRTKPSEYVFPSAAGDKPLRDIKKFWASVCKAAELKDFHLHDLRHVFARRTLNSPGVTRDIVMELLGQRSSAMVKRYAKFDSETLRAAANQAALSGPALKRRANKVVAFRRPPSR